MSMTRTVAAALIVGAITGCVREEIPVPRQPRDAVECQVNVGSDYNLQIWYDLENQQVVSQNSKMDWDLAFESAPNGWQVRLNYARLMRAHRSQAAFDQATDTVGLGNTWKVDLPDGGTDSMAIGDWRQEQPVFIMDMGYNTIGLPMGLRKFQVLGVSATEYQFRTAKMNGSDVQQYTVQKDPSRSYTHFSLSSGTVQIAPPRGEYDMVFTQYTEQFRPPDPYQAYLVTGVINGYSGIRVAQLSGDFTEVTLADTLAHPFSRNEDVIGYDWKDYSFDTGQYEVASDQIYIVQTRSGAFYKLHFVDYYDDQGVKGSPKFELLAL